MFDAIARADAAKVAPMILLGVLAAHAASVELADSWEAIHLAHRATIAALDDFIAKAGS